MSDLNFNWVAENFKQKTFVFFDIGSAKIENAAIVKQLIPLSTCYSFECSDQWLKENTVEAYQSGTYYFHCAISDKDGIETFYPSNLLNEQYWPWSGSTCQPLIEEGFVWGTPYTVDSIRLDTFCDRFNVTPDFIHIDVQGGEYKALSGIGKYRPKCVWAEVSEFEHIYETGVTAIIFDELMYGLGYVKHFEYQCNALYCLTDFNPTPYRLTDNG
jgi:FkbM family methyltransferase